MHNTEQGQGFTGEGLLEGTRFVLFSHSFLVVRRTWPELVVDFIVARYRKHIASVFEMMLNSCNWATVMPSISKENVCTHIMHIISVCGAVSRWGYAIRPVCIENQAQ